MPKNIIWNNCTSACLQYMEFLKYSNQTMSLSSQVDSIENLQSSATSGMKLVSYHPQGNGVGERWVQTAKNILHKCSIYRTDVRLTLLKKYRNTSRNNQITSPNEKWFSRVTRSQLPTTINILKPKIIQNVEDELTKLRIKQKEYVHKHKKTKGLPNIREKVLSEIEHRNWKECDIKNPRTDEGNDKEKLRYYENKR